MSEIKFLISDPAAGIDRLSISFDDLPDLTAEQRTAALECMQRLVDLFVRAPRAETEKETQ